ncbi:MAG: heavy metal-associated domain-containing protein [Phycisphaerae bacterium]
MNGLPPNALEKELAIRGMHCDACVTKIANSLRAVPGILDAVVTRTPPRVTLRMEPDVEIENIRTALAHAGDYQLAVPHPPRSDESLRGDGGEGLHRLERPHSSSARTGETSEIEEKRESLYPLLLIIGFIAGVTVLDAIRRSDFAPTSWMNSFMAGFFIVFGFFKLLDLRGFVDAYRMYDVVAKKFPVWAWLYPFVELSLGVAYFLALYPIAINIFTLIVMLIGAAGVWRALANKQRIRCACLGTVLNLPMTTVTLVEDLGMAAMASAMLVLQAS